MLVLAIDTSSAAVTAAVVELTPAPAVDGARDATVRAETTTLNARGHGEHLAPNIASCLRESAAAPRDLAAIVAGTGPGPFTGLRVGLVTAAVMSEALGIPAYGVCSLDAIAPRDQSPGTLLVATDARRKEVYWARYDRFGERLEGPAVAHPVDVPTDTAVAMAGAGARLYADVLGLPLIDCDFPRAEVLVALAADRVRAHAPADPLTPLYLRRPDAATPHAPKHVTQAAP